MLLELLERQVENLKKVGVAFSGGVDSFTVAYLCSRHAETTLYTVGFPDSHDVKAAGELARVLELEWVPILLDREKLEEAVLEVLDFLEPGPRLPVEVCFEIPLYLVAKNSRERVVVAGQGSDELLLGYHRYRNGISAEEQNRLLKELEKTVERERAMFSRFGKELVLPFTDPEVVEFCLSLPPGERADKKILRSELSRIFPAAASRKKKAAQYGSGVVKELKKISGGRLSEYVRERLLISRLLREISGPVREADPFRVLVSCVISQRSREERTEEACRRLFSRAKTPEEIVELGPERVSELIKPAGLYREKAARIVELCKRISSGIPDTREGLMGLPGVGPKTADVVLCYGFGKPVVAVDTHVNRISKRLGLVPPDASRETVKRILEEKIPPKFRKYVNQGLVRFGREVCRPVRPRCGRCSLSDLCPKVYIGSRKNNNGC